MNMISFKGRNNILQNADRITRKVNSVYPHISESKSKDYISKVIEFSDFNSDVSKKMMNLSFRNAVKLDALRFRMPSGIELFKSIIYALKDKHIGNCYESARLAEIIAKINGQDNVYSMKTYVARNRSGMEIKLEHVVSVMTNQPIEAGKKYIFKNKDAVIIDPWFGITDFASKYVERLKNDFMHHFMYMPNNNLVSRMISKQAKTPQEYNALKKEKFFNPPIRFLLHEDDVLTKEQAKELRDEYPELILDDFKKIDF